MKELFSKNKAGCAFLVYVAVISLLALPGMSRFGLSASTPNLLPAQADALPRLRGMPILLNAEDAARYADAFQFQKEQQWQEADGALAAISDPILKGNLLAERYLSRKYQPSAEELTQWLASYRELPQAYDIYQRANREYGVQQPAVHKPTLISMRGDDNGLAANFSESKYYGIWHDAINAYKTGKYTKAGELFDQMLSEREQLPAWKRSAAAFWAWRTHLLLNEKDKASAALLIAASEPRSFYGILARKQLRQPLELDDTELELSQEQIDTLMQYPAVKRATALSQLGRTDLAEQELRLLYSSLPSEERYAVLCLAHQFSLPALQIALAKRLETKENRLDIAKYPIPDWEPAGGFSVDPALIYALVRQESGFRSGAISPAGAMGLMQLMPTTADMMSHKIGVANIQEMSEAERNLTLGQSYVRHLLENQLVNNNMIYMLTAYNAGIGRLQEWKNSMNYRNDPLLFIETMPYAETRYYVQQVMTNYWLYNELLGIPSPTLASLASNLWPVYVKAG